jgi:hypothetical protein
MRDLDPKTYKSEFLDTDSRRKKALREALEFRRFEIDLYWKRATYFWTFIGAVFAGYGASQALSDPVSKEQLSVFASCLGLVFSVAWYCVNRGSKQWQENWEYHVDLLEDEIVGPLYKSVIRNPPPASLWAWVKYGVRSAFGIGQAPKPLTSLLAWVKCLISGAGNFSVTKINQIVSLFVTGVWVILLAKSLLPTISFRAPISWPYATVVGIAVLAVVLIFTLGRTVERDRVGIGTIRTSSLRETDDASGISLPRGSGTNDNLCGGRDRREASEASKTTSASQEGNRGSGDCSRANEGAP